MRIELQSRNLFVSYIQSYLRDYFGTTLVQDSSGSYQVSQSNPIKVTGYYNKQTYLSVSLFMYYNYPNEQFPVRWDLSETSEGLWIQTPFNSTKLLSTMNLLINQNYSGTYSSLTEEDYQEFLSTHTLGVSKQINLSLTSNVYVSPVIVNATQLGTYLTSQGVVIPTEGIVGVVSGNLINSRAEVSLISGDSPIRYPDGRQVVIWTDDFSADEDPDTYLPYEELLRYFSNPEVIYSRVQSGTTYEQSEVINNLIVFLSNNLEQVNSNRAVMDLDERILSYFMEEVISSLSSPDEIMRVQQLLYPEKLIYTRVGVYDEQMQQDVAKVQQDFINNCSTYNEDGTVTTALPEGYEGFKVTSYVDPWTELILQDGGYVL